MKGLNIPSAKEPSIIFIAIPMILYVDRFIEVTSLIRVVALSRTYKIECYYFHFIVANLMSRTIHRVRSFENKCEKRVRAQPLQEMLQLF